MKHRFRLVPAGLILILGLSLAAWWPLQAFCQQQAAKDSIQHRTLSAMYVTLESRQPLRDYRPSAPKINDLVSTRLDVRFDFHRRYLYGKAWIALRPHFYPTDSLCLDAKGMLLKKVALQGPGGLQPLRYSYDGKSLRIVLPGTYRAGETYTVYIEYTARPDELKSSLGSAAITSDKGLYFINPDGSNPYQPTEVWTQGETQSNSVWFPTIDRPDQKSLEEISMTVPDSMRTLSNGKLIRQQIHPDGTRTDTWKLDKPNAPYLFMMAAGPFVIVHDHAGKIPVDYYVERTYAPYARQIFAHTPAMIEFYAKTLGVPYPWNKYDQIVARDYISGAMENTTATLHGEFMYQTPRQMADDNYRNESVIAHELFHQWFGDLVTCESWSNLTLNESFADFAEMLWAGHEYGRDLAGAHSYQAMQAYFQYAARGKDHPLVDFYYKNREDVFDRVTYQKGGRVLNMLRHTVGDAAFYASLRLYLNEHRYQSAEAQDLRLAFEQVTGRDLHWFWNQWYYAKGYPKLDITYRYDSLKRQEEVIVQQTQDGRLFELPFDIDVYIPGKVRRFPVTMMDQSDTFRFPSIQRPLLVNVDAEKYLLCQKRDHKSLRAFIYQYHHAPLYLDRREAIEACAANQDQHPEARQLLIQALQDPFSGLRALAARALDLKQPDILKAAQPDLLGMLRKDSASSVRAAALRALASCPTASVDKWIRDGFNDPSLRVEAVALQLEEKRDSAAALWEARHLEASAEYPLNAVICQVLARSRVAGDFPYVRLQTLKTGSFQKLDFLGPYLDMLGSTVNDTRKVDEGLSQLKAFKELVGPVYGSYVDAMLARFSRLKRQQLAEHPELHAALQTQLRHAAQLKLLLAREQGEKD